MSGGSTQARTLSPVRDPGDDGKGPGEGRRRSSGDTGAGVAGTALAAHQQRRALHLGVGPHLRGAELVLPPITSPSGAAPSSGLGGGFSLDGPASGQHPQQPQQQGGGDGVLRGGAAPKLHERLGRRSGDGGGAYYGAGAGQVLGQGQAQSSPTYLLQQLQQPDEVGTRMGAGKGAGVEERGWGQGEGLQVSAGLGARASGGGEVWAGGAGGWPLPA